MQSAIYYTQVQYTMDSVRYVYTHTFRLPGFVIENPTCICIQAYCAMAHCHLAMHRQNQ